MLRKLSEAMKATLRLASIETLKLPMTDANLALLTINYPDEARSAFAALNVQDIGRALGRSLPRHWRTLYELSWWTRLCGSDVSEQIIRACNIEQLQQQLRRYGPTNPGELRLLLHFISSASAGTRRSVATILRDEVRCLCELRDSEARSTITAYQRLDAELGARLAAELGIVPEEIKEEVSRGWIDAKRQRARAMDAKGEDYEIDFGGDHESH